jgi:hypothetical protein
LAKNSDHLADSLESDHTAGLLGGLLAEEDDLDRRTMWRLGSWGVGAVVAVIVAVMANQTSVGWKRDEVAAADLTRQAQQIQLVARETHSEARRLAAAIDTLNSDRDRLYTRVTSLEQGLDSVTGAIVRQGSSVPAPQEPQPAQNPTPAIGPVATTQIPPATHDKASAAAEPNPATTSTVAKDLPKNPAGRPDTIKPDAIKADVTKAEIAKAEPAKTDNAKIEIAIAKIDVAKGSDAVSVTPLVATKSLMAPPDPAAAKLTEPTTPATVTATPLPEVVASTPAATDAEADEETGPKVAVRRTEFGVDVGTANSVNGLRALWRGLLKSKSNAPLTALRPLIVIKEAGNGAGMQLRLVAGPLNDAGAAAKICAVLTENKRDCETTIFDGQRLSLTVEDAAPARAGAKPSTRRRAPKRAVAVVEEPAKKPEASTAATVSSWFGKKGQ